MIDFKNLDKNDPTDLAMKNPTVGDMFHEMYSYYVVVLKVTDTHITIMEANPPCKLPRDGKTREMARDEFIEHFSYGSIPGYWVKWHHRADVAGWIADPYDFQI